MRNNAVTYGLLTLVLMGMSAGYSHAQKYPDRKLIREGNREYIKEDYLSSEERYRNALAANPESFEAQFNLGNTLFMQERYDEAETIFESLIEKDDTEINLANSYYNYGNSLFAQEKYVEALDAYRNTLLLNPEDMDAKFNYAYTKELLKSNDDDQDDDQQDGEGDGESDGGGDQQPDNEGDNEQNEGESDTDSDNPQPQEAGITKEQAEQLLQDMQSREDRTREKVEEQNEKAAAHSLKNW